MRNNNKLRLGAVLLVAVAFTATACSSSGSGDSSMSTSSATTSAMTAKVAVDSPASTVRATLTSQLNDHVWLAGNALDTAVREGGNLNDPQVKAAVAALDENSVALSKTLGSVYPDAEAPFLASWRQHIGFFVNYTLAKATKDSAKQAKAEKDLDGYRTSFGQLINSVVPELPASAVADELKPHVASLLTAIDASVAGSPTYQAKLADAAEHMQMTGQVLADGIARNKGLEGSATGPAATLRATLTGQLQDHVWLAGNALQTAVLKKGDLKNKQVAGAVAALDENSVALSKTLGSVYPDAEAPFLASWRQHIGFFVNYTLGEATKDTAMSDKAKTDLDGYRTSFGQLINSVVPELPAMAVSDELKPHVASLLTAIDSAVASNPDFQMKLTESADHMQMTAQILATGIATNKSITT